MQRSRLPWSRPAHRRPGIGRQRHASSPRAAPPRRCSPTVTRAVCTRTPQFRAQVSLLQLTQTIGATLAKAPVGPVHGESALPLAPDEGIYQGDYRWGAKTLAITLVFDARGRIAGGLVQERKPLPPDPHAGYRQHTRLRLPFDGTWWVFWGGATELQNYHVIAPDQRHAWDILVWRKGGTHHGDGKRLTDYWAFGRPNPRLRPPA